MNLKPTAAIVCVLMTALCTLAAEPAKVPATKVDHPGLKKLGWQQALSPDVFQGKSLPEALELMHALDVHHVELPPQQSEMTAEQITALLAKLKEVKMDIVGYRVTGLGSDDAADARTFAQAAKLKAKNIVAADVPESALPRLSNLCDENNVKLALLTPPKSFGGLSERVGICLDTATADPARLPERVIEVRVSGSNQQANAAVIDALQKRGFKGVFCVNPASGTGEEALEKIAAAINAFNELVTKAAAM